MRMSRIAAAAGLLIATMGIGTAADAQPGPRHEWRDGRHQGWHDNGRHRGWGNDRGWRDGRRGHHPRCWTEWRHHHRVRVCR